MADVLEKIEAYKRDEIAAAKRARPLAVLRAEADRASPARGFVAGIERRRARGGTALIAGIKKASPSEGVIRADFGSPILAPGHEAGGGACPLLLAARASV